MTVPHSHHGMRPIRNLNRVDPLAMIPDQPLDSSGGFGRLFPKEPHQPADQDLIQLGQASGPMDEGVGTAAADNPTLPLGFVFFGQFVDHDITLDKTPGFPTPTNPGNVINVRTPNLELDSVYGAGPSASPELYDSADPAKLRVGTPANPDDLPRVGTTALLGDERNDENLVISQLHLGFLRFHNKVVDEVRAGGLAGNPFPQAQRLVRWHYQWIVVHDFLPRIIGQAVVDDILKNGRKEFKIPHGKPLFIPVEFSVAAYRYGHSQVRAQLDINPAVRNVPLFGPTMTGFQPVPPDKVIDWSFFFDTNPAQPPQRARKLDGKLGGVLFDLPFLQGSEPDANLRSLAVRNLLRGKVFSLATGQTVAKRLKAKVLTDAELGLPSPFHGKAPLWFYILKEAEIQQNGERLATTGARLVGEVVLGLLQEDPDTYLNASSPWAPTLRRANANTFTLVDLLQF